MALWRYRAPRQVLASPRGGQFYKGSRVGNANACTFSSRPPTCPVAPCIDEGRMKGLAFAYDPSGYWIELVRRNKEAGHLEKFNLGQTMLRVKDVKKSLDFYAGESGMGMTKASGV